MPIVLSVPSRQPTALQMELDTRLTLVTVVTFFPETLAAPKLVKNKVKKHVTVLVSPHLLVAVIAQVAKNVLMVHV